METYQLLHVVVLFYWLILVVVYEFATTTASFLDAVRGGEIDKDPNHTNFYSGRSEDESPTFCMIVLTSGTSVTMGRGSALIGTSTIPMCCYGL
jgi:hypothetical protein